VKIREKIHAVRADVLVTASYAIFAVVLVSHLWRDPNGRMLADNKQDHIFFEWVLTHAARVVTHGDSPIFTEELNAPLGVNLMANTSILGLAIPLSPITLIFGAGVTFALLTTLALFGTATAWYYVLSRDLVRSRAAAAVGGLFCGFAPAMVSQDTGHPNIAGQFMIPFIVRAVLRLRQPGPVVRRGLVLAALVIYQCFLNEEMLFLTALALLVFLLVYLPVREIIPTAKAALPTLGVAVGISAAVLAYPLWHQFAGPQAYHGLPKFVLGFSTDLDSYKEFSRRSIVADVPRIAKMGGPTEENSFFGRPLVLVLVPTTIALWRQRAGRALVVTGAVFGVLSLGSTVRYHGVVTSWRGPWGLFDSLPLFNSVVPTRLALVVTPVVGLLLALLVDRHIARPAPPVEVAEAAPAASPVSPASRAGRPRLASRLLWAGALVGALVPLIPTPHPTVARTGLPTFFSSGRWHDYLPPHATVVPAPSDWNENLEAMQWSTQANLDFRLVGGYFLAPDPNRPDREASFGPTYPATMRLLLDVAGNGQVPTVTPEQRAQARSDIAYWRATNIVLPDQHANSDAVRQTVDQLFGPGKHIDDIWLWDVRSSA
jgi:hypothetical protein